MKIKLRMGKILFKKSCGQKRKGRKTHFEYGIESKDGNLMDEIFCSICDVLNSKNLSIFLQKKIEFMLCTDRKCLLVASRLKRVSKLRFRKENWELVCPWERLGDSDFRNKVWRSMPPSLFPSTVSLLSVYPLLSLKPLPPNPLSSIYLLSIYRSRIYSSYLA